MPLPEITILGAIGGESSYSHETIATLLATEKKSLMHGDTFTGRPSTELHIDEKNVLKVRSELKLPPLSANRWAAQALARERQQEVHHPAKTWFVAETNNQCLIGSICPRLQPLHKLLENPVLQSNEKLAYLQQMFEQYLRLASEMEVRLDEGLSNFAADNNHVVFYLDDDHYKWDRFISMAHALGMLIRTSAWLDSASAAVLGSQLREQIRRYFGENYLTVLASQLDAVPLVNEEHRELARQLSIHLKPKSAVAGRTLSKARYMALLADVHSNLPALNTVLTFLRTQNIEQGLVLGDIVGYGPQPAECIERLRDSNLTMLQGNHDNALATGDFSKGFSKTAAWVLNWSLDKVSQEQKAWLASLPPKLSTNEWMAVHGAPIDPTFFNAYVYEMTYQDNLDILQERGIPVCFHGHTHRPGVYGRKGPLLDEHYGGAQIDVSPFRQALICPGSVGQPRNTEKGAQFMIYDQKLKKISYQVLSYNTNDIVRHMKTEEFPGSLIKLLQLA